MEIDPGEGENSFPCIADDRKGIAARHTRPLAHRTADIPVDDTMANTVTPQPLPESPFVELFRSRAAAPYLGKPFLVDRLTLTYGDVAECSRRLGAFLRARGVAAGARAAIVSSDDVAVVLLFLAALCAGVTAIVLDPGAPPSELGNLLRAGDASIVFMDEAIADRLDRAGLAVAAPQRVAIGPLDADFLRRPDESRSPAPTPDAASPARLETFPQLLREAAGGAPRAQPATADVAAYILFTSGSTAAPKGVELSHDALFECLTIMCRQFGYDADSSVLNVLPLHHADGLSEGVALTFFAGATLHRPARFSVQTVPTILETVATQGVTHLHGVPTMLALIERSCPPDRQPFRTPGFRHVLSTGGPLPAPAWRAFEQRFGVQVVNAYGMTEAGRELLFCGPDAATRRIGTNGRPVGCMMRIVDEAGQPVRRGEAGEMHFRAEHFTTGYFRRPEESSEVLHEGWLRSGDLAIEDEDGFVTIVGRKKNVIVTGGANVQPEEVSQVIARLPGVADVVTLGMPDEVFGERVVSCVVATAGSTLSEERVIEHCRAHLAGEKVPHGVFVVEALPRGIGGKLVMPQVRAMAAALTAGAGGQADRAAAPDPTERVLALAARCFKAPLSPLTRDCEADTTPGWNSLAHMDFIVALETEFGVSVDAESMLEIVTLGHAIDLMQRLHETAKAPAG